MPSAAAAPPAAEVAGPPRTELEELQIKANQVTDDVNIFNNNTYLCSFKTVCMCGVQTVRMKRLIVIYLYYNRVLICSFLFFTSFPFRK